jgi:integrase
MHVVLRGGELRMGRWSEIVGAEWRIAAPRMKVKVDHIVPLSAQARELLAQLRTFTGDSEWLFPKARGTGCMSENTVQNCIERLGYTSAR